MIPESYWPKMEDDLDGPMTLKSMILEVVPNAEIDQEKIVLVWEQYMGDLVEVVRHCPITESSRASAFLARVLRWIARDGKLIKGNKYSKAEAKELLGFEVEDICLRDAMCRNTTRAMREAAVRLNLQLTDKSLTEEARICGVSKQRLDIQVREFNEEFKIKGRFQKSETASLSYAEAQMGNNNRVKNLTQSHGEDE